MIAAEKEMDIRRVARAIYSRGTDWVGFYREILGLRGLVRRLFPTQEELAEFEQTEAYKEIQEMLAKLRESGPVLDEPVRVITVRLPKSLHESLRVEAHEHCTSMNKLCISKLLQFIESDRVPTENP
jgi:hypothetical protein